MELIPTGDPQRTIKTGPQIIHLKAEVEVLSTDYHLLQPRGGSTSVTFPTLLICSLAAFLGIEENPEAEKNTTVCAETHA